MQLVLDLLSRDLRENALLELSKKREAVPDLAPILWHSVGMRECVWLGSACEVWARAKATTTICRIS